MELRLGEKVRLRRKQLGLTLKELAGERVTAAQISAIEKGKCNPSTGLLNYISERLDVEPEYFMLSEAERYKRKFETIRLDAHQKQLAGDFTAARESVEKARAILSMLTDVQKGYYYYIIGCSMYQERKHSDAFVTFIKALTYYNKSKDADEIIDIYYKIATCLANMDKHGAAIGYYKAVITYGNKKNKQEQLLKSMYNIALCCVAVRNWDEAYQYINKLEAVIANEPSKNVYKCGINMLKGIIGYRQEKYEESLQCFYKAFEVYKDNNDITGMGRAKNNIGLCLIHSGQLDNAIANIQEAIDYKIQNDDSSLVESYLNMAEIYENQGKWDKALEIVNGAEEYILAKDLNELAGPILRAKFIYLMKLKNYDKAEIFAFLALDCIQKTHNKREEADLYVLISSLYNDMGDEKNALAYLTKANKLI